MPENKAASFMRGGGLSVPSMMRTAIFRSIFEHLDAMRTFVGQAAKDAGMDASTVYQVQMAVDEACSNIIEHGCQGRCDQDIEITCTNSDKALTILVHDHGQAFDPASRPMPKLDGQLDERPIGGLGIYLMRKTMDEIRYETMGEAGNVLTLVKNLKKGT